MPPLHILGVLRASPLLGGLNSHYASTNATRDPGMTEPRTSVPEALHQAGAVLLRARHNLNSLPRADGVCDLCCEEAVVHEEEVDVADVVDEEGFVA